MTELLNSGDLHCDCGMDYRYLDTGHELTVWPRNGVRSYRPVPMQNVSCLVRTGPDRCGAGSLDLG
jgi:hypothetical protein